MRKLNLHSIRDLVVYAIKNRIIQIDVQPESQPHLPPPPQQAQRTDSPV
jgi:hypothetical protein